MIRAIPYVFGSVVTLILLGCIAWAAVAYLPDFLSGTAPLIVKLGVVFLGTLLTAPLIAVLWAFRQEYLED